jgi:hypothetical protein
VSSPILIGCTSQPSCRMRYTAGLCGNMMSVRGSKTCCSLASVRNDLRGSTPGILALRRLRQKDCKFKASQGYLVTPAPKKQKPLPKSSQGQEFLHGMRCKAALLDRDASRPR